MRPVCIVHTSLKSYICQLTNREKSESNNTPEGRYPKKRSHPSKMKLHTRGSYVFACNIHTDGLNIPKIMNIKAYCHKLRANYIKTSFWAQ